MAQELRVLLDQELRENQCFWVRDKKGTKAEIDFVWQHGTHVIPIEVKAGTNSHLRSLHSFVNTSKHLVTAVRFWSGEFFVQDAITPEPDNRPYRLINIPFYYIGQLCQILQNNDVSLKWPFPPKKKNIKIVKSRWKNDINSHRTDVVGSTKRDLEICSQSP